MEINSALSSRLTVTLDRAPASVRTWQIGQILHAVARGAGEQGRVSLQIGSQTLEARLPIPVHPGQRLTLQVIRTDPKPLLRLHREPQQIDLQRAALRSALPRQAPLRSVLSNVAHAAQPRASLALPDTVRSAAQGLLGQLAEARAVTKPQGLKAALQNAGTSLEAKIVQLIRANPGMGLDSDLKVQLLRLQRALARAGAQSPPRDGAPGNRPAPGPSASPAGTASPTYTRPTNPPSPPQPARTSSSAGRSPAPGQSGAEARPGPASEARSRSGPQGPALPTTPPKGGAAGMSSGARTTGAASSPQSSASMGSPSQPAAPSGTQAKSAPASSAGSNASGVQSSTTPPGPARSGNAPTPGPRPGPAPPPASTPVPLPTLARVTNAAKALNTLLQEVEGGLARLQVNQLSSRPTETEGRGFWLFELPLRREEEIDLFQLRITRDGKGPETDETTSHRWTVQLSFDLPGLGPVQAQVGIHGESVSTLFWAEHAATTRLLEEHLGQLRQGLDQAGLSVDSLACRTGRAPAPADELPDSVLDENA